VKDEEGGDEENQLVMSSHHLYPKQLYTKRFVGPLTNYGSRIKEDPAFLQSF
jgi:hypothetical protein